MNKRKIINITVVLVALIIVGIQFLLPQLMGEFKGTDDQAVGLISEINPQYKPWADHLWEPTGEWGETMFFALQTCLGLGIIVFYILKRRAVKI